MGQRDDARGLLAGFDVYVNSSTSEGVSLSILEAMAARLPVVATRVGGTPEVIVDGSTGMLVPARSPDALTQALTVLAADARRRTVMGESARFSVEQRFTIDRMVEPLRASVHAPGGLTMCGIAGAFAIDGPLSPLVREAIEPMTSSIRHRGPDGAGYFADDHVALGHRRLAIIDLSGGAQPMTDHNGLWVVFNGEIYNHRALRAELEGGDTSSGRRPIPR